MERNSVTKVGSGGAVRRSVNPKYRFSDERLHKLDILRSIVYADSNGIPKIKAPELAELPERMVCFSKIFNLAHHNCCVNFYESDSAFIRVFNNPKRYVPILQRFPCVVGPDLSQKVGMPGFLRYSHSCWNKAMAAYWQMNGITVIPNVSWSLPDSYDYAFVGIPTESVIAINSTAVKGNRISSYFWHKGYETALKVLRPSLILRYGDKMPDEDDSISAYYENENLKRLRNGRER